LSGLSWKEHDGVRSHVRYRRTTCLIGQASSILSWRRLLWSQQSLSESSTSIELTRSSGRRPGDLCAQRSLAHGLLDHLGGVTRPEAIVSMRAHERPSPGTLGALYFASSSCRSCPSSRALVITPLSRLEEAREALEPPAQASVEAWSWTYPTRSSPAPRDLRRDRRERVEHDAQHLGTPCPCVGPWHPVCKDVGARSDTPSPRACALGAEELRDWKPGMHCVLAKPWGCVRTSRRR
jgi:hypothetical protein